MKKISVCLSILSLSICYSQTVDSTKTKDLEEVIIIGKKGPNHQKESKPLSTLDEYMENSGKINMIKRGNYAWEPTINNMATERISVTIDGMKIFNACTDKMDPVTSYVEISNLKDIELRSGLESGIHGGGGIGGGLNLNLNKAGFSGKKWRTALNTGYESNGDYHINGLDLAYSSSKFYTNFGIFHRKSENYDAGDHQEILYSQFEKFNTYINAGYQFSKSRILEASFIYDDASNVGYPALSMDVKTARAWIASLSYKKEKISDIFSLWETKLYYNSITHKMDDTKRPDVPIHMDMPGLSKTYGFYSMLKGKTSRHSFILNWDGYYNQSEAEMTMYPNDPNEAPMFMYTWPDVRTFNTGLSLEDEYSFNEANSLHVSANINFQHEGIQSDAGLQTIRIFYPDTDQYQSRFLVKAAAHYQYHKNNLELMIGGGYGERAPSVSEAYGFYLFNSFDNYDYIGDPSLKKERSLEGSISLNLKKGPFVLDFETNYFHFFDYILGIPDPSLLPMTLGARGVKLYTNIDYASLFNTRLLLKYRFFNYFQWINQISYSIGRDNHADPLPLIAPLMYSSALRFQKSKFNSEISIKGAGKHNDYSPEFGESRTPDYLIYNLSLGYTLNIDHYELAFKAGVENIFDEKYTTYSDWNNIPRKGRNYFVNVLINL